MERRIRVATTDDAGAVHRIYAPFVESTPITFEVEPPTTSEMADRIETTLEDYPWLVCETDDGAILGYAAAGELRSKAAFQWSAELSVYVQEKARGSGVGTALYTALLESLTAQNYYSAYGVVTRPNPASVRLHERLDFEPVGTFPDVGHKQDGWHDVQWWHRQLADRPADPDPPEPLAALRETDELDRALEAGEEHLLTDRE